MKKMKFSSLKAKMVLPLFLLFGLFVLSSNSANAQFVERGNFQKLFTRELHSNPLSLDYLRKHNASTATIEKAMLKREALLAVGRLVKTGSTPEKAFNTVFNYEQGLRVSNKYSKFTALGQDSWLYDYMYNLLTSE